jgi:hypothetical protein
MTTLEALDMPVHDTVTEFELRRPYAYTVRVYIVHTILCRTAACDPKLAEMNESPHRPSWMALVGLSTSARSLVSLSSARPWSMSLSIARACEPSKAAIRAPAPCVSALVNCHAHRRLHARARQIRNDDGKLTRRHSQLE